VFNLKELSLSDLLRITFPDRSEIINLSPLCSDVEDENFISLLAGFGNTLTEVFLTAVMEIPVTVPENARLSTYR
jgi:hypothetical protein